MKKGGRVGWRSRSKARKPIFRVEGAELVLGIPDKDALAALTRNEVEGSKFLSLTANLSGWVFTSGLRVAWGTVFTVCCIPRKLELGLERAGRRISGRIIISGYIRFLKFSIIDIAK